MNNQKIYDTKLKLRQLRESMIQLHNKEKSHNENIRETSPDISTIRLKRYIFLDQYINLHKQLLKLLGNKTQKRW